jgi:hypothetical protein
MKMIALFFADVVPGLYGPRNLAQKAIFVQTATRQMGESGTSTPRFSSIRLRVPVRDVTRVQE